MYVAEGEKVPDDCILCDHIYFIGLCFVALSGFDSLPMATARSRDPARERRISDLILHNN